MASSRVTLRDIAEEVGVNPSTVSRALNPKTRGMVTGEIARQITEAADRMGYRPNPFAYSLRTNRSFTVGVLVPDLTNPAFAPIIKGIDNVLEASGYSVMVANTDNVAERERKNVAKFRERHVDGLVIATARRHDPLIDECRTDGTPLVLAVRKTTDSDISSVVSDELTGGETIMSHLAQLGHRRVAYVAGPQELSTGFERHQGYVRGLNANNIEYDAGLVEFCDAFTEEEGRRAASRLLASGQDFTAVVAANDMIAIGIYDELQTKGLVCGKDISVVGYDDMLFSSKFDPPLTTMHSPLLDIGAEAARILLEQIEDPETPPRSVKMTPELILRKSTGKPA